MRNEEQLKEIFNQYVNGKSGDLHSLEIPVTEAMQERLERFSTEFESDPESVAGFLLFSYLVELDQKAEIIKQNIMPKN